MGGSWQQAKAAQGARSSRVKVEPQMPALLQRSLAFWNKRWGRILLMALRVVGNSPHLSALYYRFSTQSLQQMHFQHRDVPKELQASQTPWGASPEALLHLGATHGLTTTRATQAQGLWPYPLLRPGLFNACLHATPKDATAKGSAWSPKRREREWFVGLVCSELVLAWGEV